MYRRLLSNSADFTSTRERAARSVSVIICSIYLFIWSLTCVKSSSGREMLLEAVSCHVMLLLVVLGHGTAKHHRKIIFETDAKTKLKDGEDLKSVYVEGKKLNKNNLHHTRQFVYVALKVSRVVARIDHLFSIHTKALMCEEHMMLLSCTYENEKKVN